MTESHQYYNPFTYQFSFSEIALSFLKEKLQYEPTEVILFKKVPYNTSELDLLKLCKSFGHVEDICFIKAKGYAFVQFKVTYVSKQITNVKKETKMAQNCYETFKAKEPVLNDSKLYVFYTGKHEITKPEGLSSYPSRFILITLTTLMEKVNPQVVENFIFRYGNPIKVMILQDYPFNAIIEMQDIEDAIKIRERINNLAISKTSRIYACFISGKFNPKGSPKAAIIPLDRDCISVDHSLESSPVFNSGENSPDAFSDELTDSLYGISPKSYEEASPKTVIVRNIPLDTTCDDLFKLFGMYGNISKIKIFYKAPDTGLIQFQESYQANLAKKFLNNCPFKSCYLNVSLSKTEISTSIGESSEFFKDYATQKGQRYRKLGSKNFRNIAQPSKVLHLSNLIPGKELSFYIDLFSTCGTVVKCMVLSGESQNVLVEMGNLQEAVEALVKFHNYEIEGKFLKVSFSKYDNIKFF